MNIKGRFGAPLINTPCAMLQRDRGGRHDELPPPSNRNTRPISDALPDASRARMIAAVRVKPSTAQAKRLTMLVIKSAARFDQIRKDPVLDGSATTVAGAMEDAVSRRYARLKCC